MKKLFYKCHDCGAMHVHVNINGKAICRDCYDHYTHCEYCEYTFHTDELLLFDTHRGDLITCQLCAIQHAEPVKALHRLHIPIACDDCGKHVSAKKAYKLRSLTLCEACLGFESLNS